MQRSNKGETLFDQMCHTVNDIFKSKNNGHDYLAKETKISCGKCGHKLKTYYCEERLYVVECEHCGVKCLVEASNPEQACYKTMAYPVEQVEDMGEEQEAVFWNAVPICEPPAYQGSVIDANFPDDMVCGMALPCPATDGTDCENGD